MNTEIHLKPTAKSVVIIVDQSHRLLIRRDLIKAASLEIRYPDTHIAFNAGFLHGTCRCIRKKVHIIDRYRTKADHLRKGEQRSAIYAFSVQMILKGEDPFVQPIIKYHILPISAHQRHGGMAVGIDECGKDYFPAAIINPVIILLGLLGSDISNLFPRYGDITFPDVTIHRIKIPILSNNMSNSPLWLTSK